MIFAASGRVSTFQTSSNTHHEVLCKGFAKLLIEHLEVYVRAAFRFGKLRAVFLARSASVTADNGCISKRNRRGTAYVGQIPS